jgi:hypothetical protein
MIGVVLGHAGFGTSYNPAKPLTDADISSVPCATKGLAKLIRENVSAIWDLEQPVVCI